MIYEYPTKRGTYKGDVSILMSPKYENCSLTKGQFYALGEFVHWSSMLFNNQYASKEIRDSILMDIFLYTGMIKYLNDPVIVVNDVDILFNTVISLHDPMKMSTEFFRIFSRRNTKFVYTFDINETIA